MIQVFVHIYGYREWETVRSKRCVGKFEYTFDADRYGVSMWRDEWVHTVPLKKFHGAPQ